MSHKREDADDVVALKKLSGIYGIGGWRDLDDLSLGEHSAGGFEKAINTETGGALWYGTEDVLKSDVVNNIELPAMVARKRRAPDYPLVPVFVSVAPGEAKKKLMAATRRKNAKLTADDVAVFMDSNGCVRAAAQPVEDLHLDVVHRYVRAAVDSLHRGTYAAGFVALSESTGTHDFTFDWRPLVNDRTRVLAPAAEEHMRGALTTFRDAVKRTTEFPHLTLDADLPLPMAALVGYEWRPATRIKLTVRQRVGSGTFTIDGDGPTSNGVPGWSERHPTGNGPTIVAVSTVDEPLTEPLQQYADQVDARRTLELHMPARLDADGIRGLARHVAQTLRQVNNSGGDKHLLLAGPSSLALLLGAASNGNGPTTMPLWNGRSYVSPLVFGS